MTRTEHWKHQPRDGGKFTAARTTETTHTQRVTETITWHPDPAQLPLTHAPGWAETTTWGSITPRELQHQRAAQVARAAQIVVAAAGPEPSAPLRLLDRETLRQVVTILRAGPHADPLELLTGRSV